MKDTITSLTERFRRERSAAHRYVALLLALAMVTTLFVNWQLHSDGIAKTADYLCKKEEHTHTAECYPQVLICGYEEGEPEDWTISQPDADTVIDEGFGVDADSGIAAESAEPEYIWVPHEHTADCYAEVTVEVPVLTCVEEEHVHTDDCFDPEDGSLICDKFEHTHDESCYTMETETEEQLVCGYEEGELVEELNPDYNPVAMFEAPVAAARPVVVAPVAEGPVHHHTDACYAPDYTADPICGKEEHHHDVNCLSDPLDGVEDESDWLAKTDTALTGMWPEDLVTVAQSQLGYEQSEKNFELDPADGVTVRHYTRYGQWYGNPYGAWDVMFLSYCLNYAGVPQSVVPQRAGTQALRSELRGSDWLKDAADVQQILPGDIVFYDAATTETVAAQQPTVSGDSAEAGIALLSVDDAAAETEAPQTEERTVTAETVGIVSDADEAGNLTVISGDVDGKVAEVSLTAADVTGVIDLNAAYEAKLGTAEEQPEEDPADEADSAVIIWAVSPASLDTRYQTALLTARDASDEKVLDSYIKKVHFQKEIKGKWTDIGPDETVEDGDTIQLVVEFDLPDGTFPSGSGTMTYQLPDGLKLDKEIGNGVIKDAGNGSAVGSYTISTDGQVTMNFETLGSSTAFSGNLTFKADVDFASAPDGEISFGNEMTLKVTPKTPDLKVSKGKATYSEKGSELWSDEQGNFYYYWQVTVSSENGSGGAVHLRDKLNTTKGFPAKHTTEYPVVLVKYNANGTTTQINTEQYPYTISEDGTVLDFASLPELAAGEKYVLNYATKAAAEDLKALYGTQKPNVMYNTAKAETDKVTAVSSSEQKVTFNRDIIKKSGALNGEGLIEWKIEIRAPLDAVGGALKNYRFSDDLPQNVQLVGSVNVEISGKTKKNVTLTPEQQDAMFHATDCGLLLSGLDSNAADAYRFVITYKTTAPSDGQKIANVGWLDRELKSTGEVTVKQGVWSLTKEHSRTENDIAYWNLNAVNAAGTDHFELTDTIGQTTDDNGTELSGQHYAIASELQAAIESRLELHLMDGTTTLTYGQAKEYLTVTYRDANGKMIQPEDGTTHVMSFTIAVKSAENKPAMAVRRIVLNGVPTHEERGAMPSGAEWTFVNGAKITQDGAEKASDSDSDVYRCHRSFEKSVAIDGKRETYFTEDFSVDYDNVKDKNLLYKIRLVTSADEKGSIIVQDTLPEGTEWGTGSDKNKLFVDGVQRAWSGGGWTITSTPSEKNGNLLVISVDGCDDRKSHVIEYQYQVSFKKDARWDDLTTSDIPYTNTAKWGEETASITTTVHKDVPSLTKTGVQQKDANGNWTNKITYTVIINPAAQTLGTGGELKLRDRVTISRGNSFYGSNVRLYYYEHGANVSAMKEVEEGRYHIDDPEEDYWLCMTIPDRTALLLQYDCEFDPGTWSSPKLTNTVYLNNDTTGTGEDVNFKVNDSEVQITRGQLVIRKTDAETSRWLPGAEFSVDRYDPDTKRFVLFKTGETDDSGELVFSITKAEETLSEGVLYRLTEKNAPDNYVLDETPRYLFFYNKDADPQEAYKEALGEQPIVDADSGIAVANVIYGVSTQATIVNVKNVYNQLSVYKYWLSATDGKPLDAAEIPVASIEVQLFRYTEGQNPEQAQLVDTQTLNAANQWSYTWAGESQIPAQDKSGKPYYYLVKEVTTGNWNAVVSNQTGIQTGKIFLTNTVYNGYELPSTGGSGTAPFAAAGGTLMALALVGGAALTLKKRKTH